MCSFLEQNVLGNISSPFSSSAHLLKHIFPVIQKELMQGSWWLTHSISDDVQILIKQFLCCMNIFQGSNHYNDKKYWYDLNVGLGFIRYKSIKRIRNNVFYIKSIFVLDIRYLHRVKLFLHVSSQNHVLYSHEGFTTSLSIWNF